MPSLGLIVASHQRLRCTFNPDSGRPENYGRHVNAVIGDWYRSIALQPLSIEGHVGVNLALGVARRTSRTVH
jgi:hypothetical protein